VSPANFNRHTLLHKQMNPPAQYATMENIKMELEKKSAKTIAILDPILLQIKVRASCVHKVNTKRYQTNLAA